MQRFSSDLVFQWNLNYICEYRRTVERIRKMTETWSCYH